MKKIKNKKTTQMIQTNKRRILTKIPFTSIEITYLQKFNYNYNYNPISSCTVSHLLSKNVKIKIYIATK